MKNSIWNIFETENIPRKKKGTEGALELDVGHRCEQNPRSIPQKLYFIKILLHKVT